MSHAISVVRSVKPDRKTGSPSPIALRTLTGEAAGHPSHHLEGSLNPSLPINEPRHLRGLVNGCAKCASPFL